jgi:DNA polymerase III epsilon subunit-like protein
MQAAATPKWFGFDTETCGMNVYQDEVIAVAAYDLDSGDAYTALINPALHNPSYKYRAEQFHGASAARQC